MDESGRECVYMFPSESSCSSWQPHRQLGIVLTGVCGGVQKIRKMENVHKKYQKQLLEEGTVKEDDLKKLQSHVSGIMSAEFEAARQYKPEVRSSFCLPPHCSF